MSGAGYPHSFDLNRELIGEAKVRDGAGAVLRHDVAGNIDKSIPGKHPMDLRLAGGPCRRDDAGPRDQ
jgi:hypothetical protein